MEYKCKIEYIAGLIVDALENYSVNGENAQFYCVIEELRKHFTKLFRRRDNRYNQSLHENVFVKEN